MRPLVLLALFAVLALSACATGDPSVAATVNGEEIPLAEVSETFADAETNPEVAPQLQGDAAEQGGEQLEAQIVGQLIQAEVIRQEAAELDVEVSDDDVQAQIDEQLSAAGGGEEALPAVLQQNQAFGEADLRLRVELSALLDEVGEVLTQDVAITDEDIATFYEEDPQGQFGPTATVRAIVVETPEAAQQAIDRVAAGEDFAAVAAELSIDPSGQQGGELPPVTQGQLPPELSEPIFAAEPGEVIGPLPIQQVFAVLQVTELTEGPSLEEATEDIRASLETQERETVVSQWISDAFMEATVEVNPRFGEWNPDQAAVQPSDPLGELQPAPGTSAAPGGQLPGGQVPGGQVPGGQVPGGQVPGGQVPPGGQAPGGQVPPQAPAPTTAPS